VWKLYNKDKDSKKDDKVRMRNKGTGCAERRQLYRRNRQQFDDSLPQKKVHFLFQQPMQSGRGIEELKGWKFKCFKVCDIPEKEPLHNKQKAINPFGTVICPK
jgi:hypothetical protein